MTEVRTRDRGSPTKGGSQVKKTNDVGLIMETSR